MNPMPANSCSRPSIALRNSAEARPRPTAVVRSYPDTSAAGRPVDRGARDEPDEVARAPAPRDDAVRPEFDLLVRRCPGP